MTISISNALPVAAVSDDVSVETSFVEMINVLPLEEGSAGGSQFSQDFWSMLKEQMAQHSDSDEEMASAVENLPEDVMGQPLVQIFNRSDEALSEDVKEPGFDFMMVEEKNDKVDTDVSAPIVDAAMVADQPVSVEPAEVSAGGATVIPADFHSNVDDTVWSDGEVLPLSRQNAAFDHSVLNVQTGEEALPPSLQSVALIESVSNRQGSRGKPVVNGLESVEEPESGASEKFADKAVSVDKTAPGDEKLFSLPLNEKEKIQTLHQKTMKFDAMLTRNDAPANQAAVAGEVSTGSGSVESTVAMLASTQVSIPASHLNATVHTLQLAPQATPAQWGDALSEKVSLLINHKLNNAEIRIDPPHLGKLDIQIQLKDDTASIHIHTHQAATRDLIDAASYRLREFLQQSGYSEVDVNVSHREQSMAQDNSQGEPQQQADTAAFQNESVDSDSAATARLSAGLTQYMIDGSIDYFA